MDEQNKQDFDRFLSLLPPVVKKNVKTVTPETLGQNFFLHIDRPPVPKSFIPRMPPTAASSENNNVARITVADTLIGCMIGYARIEHDFFRHNNGWIISKFDFEYALSVTRKMVFDADYSNEHWLVTYNKQTIDYRPIQVGKFFIHKLSYIANEKEPENDEFIEFYVELHTDDLIKINPETSISKGYYRISVKQDVIDLKKGYYDYTDVKIKKISQSDYQQVKSLAVSMLDHTSTHIPLFAKW